MSFQSNALLAQDPHVPFPQTAMILDDCDFDRAMIRRLNARLEVPLQLEEVPTIDAMNNCLNEKKFDLIMVDYGLGKDNGLNALDMISKHAQNQNAAKIMITGSNDAHVAVSAMKRGCSDFVAKKELTPASFRKSVHDALLTASEKTRRSNPELFALGTSPQAVEIAMQLALKDPHIRQALLEAIQDSRGSSPDGRSTIDYYTMDQMQMQSLIEEFLAEDDFIFK